MSLKEDIEGGGESEGEGHKNPMHSHCVDGKSFHSSSTCVLCSHRAGNHCILQQCLLNRNFCYRITKLQLLLLFTYKVMYCPRTALNTAPVVTLICFCLQYKTERDGKTETRVEKKVVISQEENGDDIDHDAVSVLDISSILSYVVY